MTDWADEIAKRFVENAKSIPVWQEEIANELREAYNRGLNEEDKYNLGLTEGMEFAIKYPRIAKSLAQLAIKEDP